MFMKIRGILRGFVEKTFGQLILLIAGVLWGIVNLIGKDGREIERRVSQAREQKKDITQDEENKIRDEAAISQRWYQDRLILIRACVTDEVMSRITVMQADNAWYTVSIFADTLIAGGETNENIDATLEFVKNCPEIPLIIRKTKTETIDLGIKFAFNINPVNPQEVKLNVSENGRVITSTHSTVHPIFLTNVILQNVANDVKKKLWPVVDWISCSGSSVLDKNCTELSEIVIKIKRPAGIRQSRAIIEKIYTLLKFGMIGLVLLFFRSVILSLL